MPSEGSLLRLPATGGSALLYRGDSLVPFEWRIPSGVPPISRVLGFDVDDQMAYAVDDKGTLVGVDMLSRRARPYLAKASHLTGTADGVVLGLDSARRVIRFAGRTLTTFRATVDGNEDLTLLRAPSGRITAYSAASGALRLLSEDGELRQLDLPEGTAASSWFGDLIAITHPGGVTLVPSSAEAAPIEVSLRGAPVVAAFSPSAHRLYVARGRGDVAVLDRFSRAQLATIDLPGAARALRPDRSGRWMLARAESGDSVWVIDLVRGVRVATVTSPWDTDLPMVTGGRTLIGRDGDDVVSWDLTTPTPTIRSRLGGAASDRYALLPWRPRGQGEVAPPLDPALVASGDTAAVPAAATGDSAQADAAAAQDGDIYIQVSSSQNEGYARALARQLREIGFRTRVLDPRVDGDGFRVLVGPYPTRDEAEADGRRLGRPYFVTSPVDREP